MYTKIITTEPNSIRHNLLLRVYKSCQHVVIPMWATSDYKEMGIWLLYCKLCSR